MNDINKKMKSVQIGATCIVTYIASYYMRNLLGVLTPAMLDTGKYTKEYIGILSSAYMVFYAIGQLTNGVLGDIFSPKRMVVIGLATTGLASIVFPYSGNGIAQVMCFAFLGYGLSMLRGPLMKIISENTSSRQARIICAFFSSAGFIGAFIAGLFAVMFHWDIAFIAAGTVIYIIAIIAYFFLTYLERKNMITYHFVKNKKKKDIFSILKADKFVFYMVIGLISEITSTSISFWIPTYLTEYLSFDNNSANVIFIIKSLLRSFSPFIAIFIYKYMSDEIKIIKYSFLTSSVLFLGMLFVKCAWINILMFFLSLMISGFAAAMLWSVYIPSLKKTGKVSSANGILDCAGYVGAAVANMVFAELAGNIGWNSVIILWTVIMLLGYSASIFELFKFKGKELKEN